MSAFANFRPLPRWSQRQPWNILASVAFVIALCAPGVRAQSNSATVSGTTKDITGAILPGVDLLLVDVNGLVERRVVSRQDGAFVVPSLPSGEYTLRASLPGFTTAELRDLVLNVGDRITLDVELTLGARGESVTVIAGAPRVRTSPGVSTVIDREFVENLPLNGRSFQSLLELTPGVTLVPAGGQPMSANSGQFSVNGQRANANSFSVDGVSVNTGMVSMQMITGTAGQTGSGQLPALTAFGTTSSLVSVDALQEFRVQTSGYSPEFGRTPGGQISLVTRSGTNMFHGSVSEYFRHERLNANDWFTNNRALDKPRMRQHNFGGVVGGPLVPGRTHFFASYEGHRVEQPRSRVTVVPSLDLRRTAPVAIQPYLNAFPLPNGPEATSGWADFAHSFSNPLRSDATSVRLDHRVGAHLLFARLNYAPSYGTTRALSFVTRRHSDYKTATVGWTSLLFPRVTNDLRVNYTNSAAPSFQELDSYGGAVPLDESIFAPGRNARNSQFTVTLTGGSGSLIWGPGPGYEQRAANLVDSLTTIVGGHELKLGVDVRLLNPVFSGNGATAMEILRFTVASINVGRTSRYDYFIGSDERHTARYDSFSAYIQDNWKPKRRLTVMYGARWDLNPPPRAGDGGDALTLENLDNPYGGEVHFAPAGTPLWRTRSRNVAIRLGGSYLISDRPSAQLLIRGGFGNFFDLEFGQSANGFTGYPFLASRAITSAPFPLADEARQPPQLGTGPPLTIWAMDRELETPHTRQWHTSVEQNLGQRQTLTVTFVGANGRKLLKLDRYNIRLLEWPGSTVAVNVNRNRGYSDYRGLQVQFQRRMHKGLQALASYALGRARDTSSSDTAVNVPAERLPPSADYGYSDFDVRHVFTAALSWQLPRFTDRPYFRHIVDQWALDFMLRSRSGLPLSITTGVPFPPDTQTVRPDVVPGQPFWVADATAPGGRRLNREAFEVPAAETQGNLLRGSVRGFGVHQVDLALRRNFRLPGSARLEVRVETFNLFNTPMFDVVLTSLDSVDFGRATVSLSDSLGGIAGIYQMGGARSMQLAAKLLF